MFYMVFIDVWVIQREVEESRSEEEEGEGGGEGKREKEGMGWYYISLLSYNLTVKVPPSQSSLPLFITKWL